MALVCGFSALPRAQAASVLVLGFVEEGKPNVVMRQSVIQFLSRMGEEVVGTSLPPADQLCTQTDCLVRLGEKHRAQRLVGGELIRNDASYRVQVWLFDRVSEMPNSAEAVCTDCNPQMLADLLSRTVGRALEVGANPPPPPPSSSAQPHSQLAPPEVAAVVKSGGCTSSLRRFGRGLAIGGLSATTAAGLVTGIALASQSGKVYAPGDGTNSDVTYDFRASSGLTFGLTALSAVGLAAAVIPWHRLIYGRERPEVCSTSPRYTFRRGLAVGSLGALTLMGLSSALALTGMNGGFYANNSDGTPVSYSLKPQYTTASVLSAGLLIGLGVAIFFP